MRANFVQHNLLKVLKSTNKTPPPPFIDRNLLEFFSVFLYTDIFAKNNISMRYKCRIPNLGLLQSLVFVFC